ncbi:MAG: PAC2 family protein [Candidatus Altiarchaeota archaeon]
MTKKVPQNPIVIEAFPSKGFVSTIAANQMINELGMEQIGCIESDELPSVTMVHDSKPLRPMRIYAKGKIVIVFSELIVPLENIPEFSKVIAKWFTDIKPKQVILLAGISGVEIEKEHEILGITTDKSLEKKLKELKVRIIEEGMITGISSDLLLNCIDKGINTVSLMTETDYVPDPLAAASVVEILNKLLNLSVKTKNLTETGKLIEEKLNEIAKQLRRGKEGYKRMEGFSPMYG